MAVAQFPLNVPSSCVTDISPLVSNARILLARSAAATVNSVDVKMLIEVGELCTKPDLNKESLAIEIADLANIDENKLVNLLKPTENEWVNDVSSSHMARTTNF